MIKPEALKKGDKVAIVSLSSGLLGEENLIHKYHIAKKRLEEEFGLKVVAMPNALKGIKFTYEHPELRAKDLMKAFSDKSIKAIICSIGGSDGIRLLPYIDYNIIKNNPKIFTGFSDSTVHHLMCYKAGVVSFYGPNIMCNFGEYVKMFDYEVEAVKNVFFKNSKNYKIEPSPMWTDDFVPWGEENVNKQKTLKPDTKGYEVLQGKGKVKGKLLGGCIDLDAMLFGTELWPKASDWKNKILFIDTSEEEPSPDYLTYILRGLDAQGVLKNLSGIIVGKPHNEKYYEEYKEVYKKVVGFEANLPNLPIIYNVNFGHAMPINIIPYGVMCELDCNNKTITLLESATK